jgi:hypothetical protein
LSSPPTYGPAPATPHQRRRGGVVGPLILIFLGCVFLLQNTGYLPPNFWLNLWRLWPVILVLVGLELLLANRVPWLALAGLAAVLLVVGAVATNSGLASAPAPRPITQSDTKSLGSARQATVSVRFDAGQLNVGPIEGPAPDQLATMSYEGPPNLVPQVNYSVTGDLGHLDYVTNEHGGSGFVPIVGGQSNTPRLNLNLNPSVPITSLSLKSGATDARLDLSALQVRDIDMSVGAASTWVRLPQAAGMTTVRIAGGASTITLEIPQDVVAQIRHRGGLSTVNVDQSRFPSVGDGVYRSPNYEMAQNKVDVNLETGITTIQVN